MPEEWEVRPPLSGVVAQQGVADAAGTLQYQPGVTSETGGDVAFAGPIADFILYGVVNGAFAQGPPDSTQNIDPINNPLPYWTGPTQVSGGAITCQWVADSSSPSGYNLRFSIAPGAAGDEAYVEQIVQIGGTRLRIAANYLHAIGVRVAASGGSPQLKVACQYLTAAGATTGSTNSGTASLAADGDSNRVNVYGSALGPPADAAFLRIRVGVVRNTMAASDTATLDFSDIRMDRSGQTTIVADGNAGTYAPGEIYQSTGYLTLAPANQSANGIGVLIHGTPLIVEELSAPSTPASGFYKVYAKTDHKIYGKGSDGTETALGGGSSGGIVIQTTISPTITGNQNNYAPTGWQTATAIFINVSSAVRTITGIDATGFVEGQSFWLSGNGNPGGNSITIANTSASSTSGNRFGCPGGVDYTIGNNGGVYVIYSPATNSTSPFRVMGKS